MERPIRFLAPGHSIAVGINAAAEYIPLGALCTTSPLCWSMKSSFPNALPWLTSSSNSAKYLRLLQTLSRDDSVFMALASRTAFWKVVLEEINAKYLEYLEYLVHYQGPQGPKVDRAPKNLPGGYLCFFLHTQGSRTKRSRRVQEGRAFSRR